VTRYLTLQDVLGIHDIQLAQYGGGTGVRDPGQLEAALFRPQTGYYAAMIAETAALWESLSQNHPFIDRNKRTAFAGMHVFPIINDYRLDITVTDAMPFVTGLYDTHSFRFEALEPWLRAHAVQVIISAS
jgi:death-on-curing protein